MGEPRNPMSKRNIRFMYWPLRYGIQLFFFMFFYALFIPRFYPSFVVKPPLVPLPVLASVGSPYTAVPGVFDLLQVMLAEPEFPWLPLAVVFIAGAVLGRLFCGWACPLGFVQILVADASGKRLRISPRTHQTFASMKFLVLVGTLIVSGSLAASLYLGLGSQYRRELGAFAFGPYTTLSPDTALFSTLPTAISQARDFTLATMGWDAFVSWLNSIPLVTAAQIFILTVFLFGVFQIPLFWCRYFCPLGALMSIFGRFSFLGMTRNSLRCTKCPSCVRRCPMQVKILERPPRKFNDQECILCLDCADACERKALGLKFP